jgi:prepilin-type N-terminal cleavage/methylation domain-containing protein
MQNTLKKSKGFTLVELLVAIAIMAILTAIVTANFSLAKARSRDAKRISDIAQLQLALELFFDKCDRYPNPDGGQMPSTSDQCSYSGSNVKLTDFIQQLPTDPLSSFQYYYYINTNNVATDYILKAVLETDNQALNDALSSGYNMIGLTNVPCHHPAPGSPTYYYYCVKPN